MQKNLGKTFVSRTTIKCPKYDHLPVVGLRVVIGNPLTEEKDIDYVFQDQANILDSGIVYVMRVLSTGFLLIACSLI